MEWKNEYKALLVIIMATASGGGVREFFPVKKDQFALNSKKERNFLG